MDDMEIDRQLEDDETMEEVSSTSKTSKGCYSSFPQVIFVDNQGSIKLAENP
jgi:hypothetical protein